MTSLFRRPFFIFKTFFVVHDVLRSFLHKDSNEILKKSKHNPHNCTVKFPSNNSG